MTGVPFGSVSSTSDWNSATSSVTRVISSLSAVGGQANLGERECRPFVVAIDVGHAAGLDVALEPEAGDIEQRAQGDSQFTLIGAVQQLGVDAERSCDDLVATLGHRSDLARGDDPDQLEVRQPVHVVVQARDRHVEQGRQFGGAFGRYTTCQAPDVTLSR